MPLPYWSRKTSILRTHTSSCEKSICAGSEYSCIVIWQSSFTPALFALMARVLSSTLLDIHCTSSVSKGNQELIWNHLIGREYMIRVCLWLECINIHPLGRFKYCGLWNYCQTRRTHGFGIKMALDRRFSLWYRLFTIIYNHINVLMVAPKSERELSLW